MALFRSEEKTRVIDEPGCVQQLGSELRALGVTRALLVSDPGVVAAGHVQAALQSIAQAGVVPKLFAEVQENPTTEDVIRGFASALPLQPEAFVAVGGGSAIDVAKGINFLLVCGGRMQDYWGPDKATRPLLPLLAVPTTAGTGSEVQSFALIGDPITHQKMACGDPSAAPRIALLDAALTLSLPPFVTACTGLDTLGHAIESAVCTRRNDVSGTYAIAACVRGLRALPLVIRDPRNLEAREEMLRASALAGFAIEHSMLGAAHALANPLTARLGLPHGQAVGTMLPRVIRFNAQDPQAAAIYADLAHAAGLEGGDAEALASAIEELLRACDLPLSLAANGMLPQRLPALAEEAASQWTAGFNPVPLDAGRLAEILAD